MSGGDVSCVDVSGVKCPGVKCRRIDGTIRVARAVAAENMAASLGLENDKKNWSTQGEKLDRMDQQNVRPD